jgi:glycosyltransferase involved in cell wall biosynthesis
VIDQSPPIVKDAAQPLVSVVMNCYNGEKYLREAIDSVRAQTYHNWEIVFWDNQSTDRSAHIFASYSDPRLKYHFAPTHTWLYEARNYAIEKAGGELLAFLDVDDRWLPSKLEKQVRLFENPAVGFVCGQYWVDDERKKKRWKLPRRRVPTGWVLHELLKDHFIGLLTLVVRRSALDSLDYPCDARYHIIGDFDLAVRLSLHWQLECVQEPVGFYRLHDDNESAKHTGRAIDELESWVDEMSKVDAIRNSRFAKNQWHYLKAMQHLLQADRKQAFCSLQALPWGQQKLRLGLAFLLPQSVITRIKN